MRSATLFVGLVVATSGIHAQFDVDPKQAFDRFTDTVIESLPGVSYSCEEPMAASARRAGADVICVRLYDAFEDFVVAWKGSLEALPQNMNLQRLLPWQVSSEPTHRTSYYTLDGIPMVVMFFDGDGQSDLIVTHTSTGLWEAGKRSIEDLLTAIERENNRKVVEIDPAPREDTGTRIAGVDGVTNPRLIAPYDAPVYPDDARPARVEATVIMQAVIGEDGIVRSVAVLKCDQPGYGFEESAVAAVSGWRYEPATLEGEPVDVHFTVVVDFNLE
jgi:TonB family protein